LNRPTRIGIGILLFATSVLTLAQQPAPRPIVEKAVVLNLAPQPLEDALHEFSRVTGLKVMLYTVLGRGIISPRVSGTLTPGAALDLLLRGAALRFEYLDAQTIAVLPAHDQSSDAISGPMSRVESDGIRTASATESAGASYTPTLRYAENDRAPTADQESNNKPKSNHQSELQEVVVTAQKRSERLQDVPIPMSVISANALVENNQVKLTDYYTQVPGLSIAPSTLSSQTLSIRGITTGAVGTGPPAAAPTVGITVDDVPYGGSAGGDTYVPDFDPGDLARIEVLRGPQGTLYGASSLGGLIKFVTVDPSTDGVSGRLEAGTNTVKNGAQLGYVFRGSVNLPLSSDVAIRASAFTRQDPGYVDNPVLGIRGINEDHASGGHLVALWRPSDTISVKFSALYQDVRGDGTSDETPNPPAILGAPTLGELQQDYIRGVGPYDKKSQAYSAIVTYKIGNFDLTALTGYNVYSFHDEMDLTSLLGPYTQNGVPGTGFNGFGVVGTPIFDSVSINRFTQEIRLSATLGQHLDLLLGGFYSHEGEKFEQNVLASNAATGSIVGHWVTLNVPNTSIEYAAFTDLTYHVTDRFDVQIGGRESRLNTINKSVTDYGIYYTALLGQASEFSFLPREESKQNAFTYLLTPRFKISPDIMVYARLASGYRAGGNNFGTPGVPLQYSPDKTRNYEIGAKGEFLDHTLSVDASVYYIDWKKIQLVLLDPFNGFSYTGNAGAAKSQGVELMIEARPVASLTIGAWMAWSDAKLTEDVPGAGQNGVIFGFSGDRLPNSPQFSGNISANEEFPLSNEIRGFVGGNVSYVGNREDAFPSASPQRQYLPAYVKTDIRAGAKYDAWTANIYVNNVADKRGLISGGPGNIIPYSYFFIQPRTIGLSVSRSF
jgi:iron complex outermembrane receptor protein